MKPSERIHELDREQQSGRIEATGGYGSPMAEGISAYLDEEAARRAKFEADVLERLKDLENPECDRLVAGEFKETVLASGKICLVHDLAGTSSCMRCGFMPKPVTPLYVGDGAPAVRISRQAPAFAPENHTPYEPEPCARCGVDCGAAAFVTSAVPGKKFCSLQCVDRRDHEFGEPRS